MVEKRAEVERPGWHRHIYKMRTLPEYVADPVDRFEHCPICGCEPTEFLGGPAPAHDD